MTPEEIANLQYSQSQLAGTTPAGLEKQNLDYAMSQLGMMTGGYGRGYTQPGDFGTPTSPQAGVTYGGTGDSNEGLSYGDSGFTPTAEDYESYLTGGRSTLQGLLNFVPFGGLFGAAADYNMGYNPIAGAFTKSNEGFYNPITSDKDLTVDDYTSFYTDQYTGPGHNYAISLGLTPGSEQYESVVNQMGYDVSEEQGRKDNNWYDFLNPFDDRTFNYDADLNIGRGMLTPEAQAVANEFTPLEGSSFGSMTEAQAVANYGFGSDEHMAALEADDNQEAIDLLTPPAAPVATVPEAPIVYGHPEVVAPETAPAPSDSGSSDSGTSASDLGGTDTSVDDAFSEISGGYDDPSESTGSSDSGGDSGGGCFVTTATLQEVDTKDDGKELSTFRDFRDNYLSKKSYGGALVRDYYATAPTIVNEINSRDNHKQLYQGIWKEHLKPINRLIEKGEEAEATSKYMLMMEELKEKFLPVKGERL